MTASGGTFGALRINNFPRIWGAGLLWGLSRWGVSFIGPFIANDLTGSARMVQLAGVAMWAPLLFGGIVGGWVSDRFDRRRVVTGQFLVVIPALLLLAWTARTDRLEVWMIYPVLFVTGVGWVFDMTCRRTIVYDIVGPGHIDNAMAIESTGSSVALAAGALVGGTLIQAAGIALALGVMAGLQVLALLLFLSVGRVTTLDRPPAGGLDALVEGVRMLRSEKALLSVLGVTSCVNFFFFSSSPLLQVVGGKFDVGPAMLGLLASMLGFGMLLGSLGVAHWQPRRRGRAYVVGSYLALVTMVGFATAPVYVLSALALLVAAVGMGLFGSTQGVLVMEAVPAERRGRALGLLSTAIGVLPIGMFALGELAEVLSPSTAVVISVLTGLALMTLWLRVRPESNHIVTGGGVETPRARRPADAMAPAVYAVTFD